MLNKKAISPLIATVLIIGFTIVLAAIVIQWGGQLVEKMKSETEVTSELSLICSTGLTELKITKAKKVPGPPDTIDVTIDNKNDQAIASMLFRKYTDTGVTTWEETNDPATPEDERSMAAFQIKTYPVEVSIGENIAIPPDENTITKIGALPKVKLSDESEKTCSKEITAPITAPI